ncbi:MAG: hypothetical protein WCY98_07155 [Castellaniella sp.]
MPPAPARLSRLGTILASCLILAGCASLVDVAPGTPLAEVQARFGAPSFSCTTANGQLRVIWTTQPNGQLAWGSNVDAAGRTERMEPLLTSERFRRLETGVWNKDSVRCEFGPPAEIGPVGLPASRQEVWSYRFKENHVWNSLMHIYFDPHTERVTRHHPGPDPMYEPLEFFVD